MNVRVLAATNKNPEEAVASGGTCVAICTTD